MHQGHDRQSGSGWMNNPQNPREGRYSDEPLFHVESEYDNHGDLQRERDRYSMDRWERSPFGATSVSSHSFSGHGPKNYKRGDDRIREDICERLTKHPEIDASEIEIDVKDGVATLTGTVLDRQTKRMAEQLAEDCYGVSEVLNQIRLDNGLPDVNSASKTADNAR